jgi:hypothetical protein
VGGHGEAGQHEAQLERERFGARVGVGVSMVRVGVMGVVRESMVRGGVVGVAVAGLAGVAVQVVRVTAGVGV